MGDTAATVALVIIVLMLIADSCNPPRDRSADEYII